uniref:Uncharacterized protein n=1 Tax=Pavo cristatus TaxID=9049 RepID=A0A8C9EH64_PAVCR
MAAVLELLLSEEVAVGAVVRWLRCAPGQELAARPTAGLRTSVNLHSERGVKARCAQKGLRS